MGNESQGRPGPERSPRLEEAVRDLVARNPGHGTYEEYWCIAEVVRRRAPCRFLVFGVGKDSRLWLETNARGRTVFLEHSPRWIERVREEVRDAVIYPVQYPTRRYQWPWLLYKPQRLRMEDLPGEVLATEWDVIFVDAPGGARWKSPGRMQSIYTAALLAKRSADVDVFVHDCDRMVERVYSDRYIGKRHLVEQVGRLRHYHLSRSAARVT